MSLIKYAGIIKHIPTKELKKIKELAEKTEYPKGSLDEVVRCKIIEEYGKRLGE